MSDDTDLFTFETSSSSQRVPFQSSDLLEAVDVIDRLRGFLSDSAEGAPPQLRTDMLNLHPQAMRMCTYDVPEADREVFLSAADDVDAAVFEICQLAEHLEGIMSRLRDFGADEDDDVD